jgi:hypothetical protein
MTFIEKRVMIMIKREVLMGQKGFTGSENGIDLETHHDPSKHWATEPLVTLHKFY